LTDPESVLVVLVSWGSDPLAVRTIARGQSLWLGDAPGDLAVPLHGTGRQRWRLVSFDEGVPRLSIPRGAVEERLELCDGASLGLNGFTFEVARVALEKTRRTLVDFRSCPRPAALAVVLLVTLIALALGVPLMHVPDSSALETEQSLAIRASAEQAPERDATPREQELRLTPTRYIVGIPGDMRCGDAEMGQPAAGNEGRYGVEGPEDNPDPHLARKLLAPRGRADNAPTAPFGHWTSLGVDPVSERGAIWGDDFAPARGEEGLGLARADVGIYKRLEWDPRTTEGAPARVLHTGLGVNGALKPSSVTRATAAGFATFRACYVRALEKSPALGGRLDVKLRVGSDGRVRDARVVSSDVTDADLTACLLESFRRLRFPEAASPTAVFYPLFLIGGERPGQKSATRRAGFAPRRDQLPACCSNAR
jgi:hypothetical protein